MILKGRNKSIHIECWRRNICICGVYTSACGVPPSQYHFPIRACALHQYTIYIYMMSGLNCMSFKFMYIIILIKSSILKLMRLYYTKNTESRAAMVRISAQDTRPGHAFSTVDLMASMTSKPRVELMLGAAFFSL